jgi:3-oxoacyl-[acyl-carrier protein] reductase
MQLEGARVLITGGGTGIGFATAQRLVGAGARVAICGRRRDVLARAGEEIGALAVPADVGDEGDVRRLFAAVLDELGGLEAVVNNAAVGYRAPLAEIERERFEDVFQVNVVGAMLVAREAARHFVERGGGTLVNVGSTAARKGYAGGSAYAASKFALTGLTECWRAELRQHGVRVMQVNPSEVQTPFGGRDVERANPSKLVAEDVAQLVSLLLALEDRGFVTEATLWATNPR